MLVCEFPSFLDVFGRKNFAGKVRFQDVLQSGDFGVIEKAAARADVGIDEARVWRILPPVRKLIAIGIEDRIEAKRLDIKLLTDSTASLDWGSWALGALHVAARLPRILSWLVQREGDE
jgi:hypothetical protein